MPLIRLFAVACSIALVLSCTKSPASSAPAPAPAQTPGAAAPSAGGAPANRPPRRLPPSRDSAAKLRAGYVAQILQSIAGHENEPAEQVFKNVQVLKGITAAQLVHKMDKEYGVALSWSCTNCHRLANQGNWASDTATDKKRARAMQIMVNDINQNHLPKLYPKNTPVVTCASCHRGYNEPPADSVLFPERGRPGAPPAPPLH